MLNRSNPTRPHGLIVGRDYLSTYWRATFTVLNHPSPTSVTVRWWDGRVGTFYAFEASEYVDVSGCVIESGRPVCGGGGGDWTLARARAGKPTDGVCRGCAAAM